MKADLAVGGQLQVGCRG
jgi:hypothetical protein